MLQAAGQPEVCSLKLAACSELWTNAMNRSQRGQHLAEYAITIAVATAALTGVSTYVRRAIQARVKATTDHVLSVEVAADLPGDVNGDGRVTITDILTVRNYLNPTGCGGQGAPVCVQFSPIQLKNADANRDGTIDQADLQLMQQMALDGASGESGAEATQKLGIRYETGDFIPGDVDGDGQVTIADIIKVVNAILGSGTLTVEELAAADVNGNGRVDAGDLTAIIQSAHGNAPPSSSFTSSVSSSASEIGFANNGDLNGDGQVTINEIIRIINHILNGIPLTGNQADVADINGDGQIDVADVVAMVDLALHGMGSVPTAHTVVVNEDQRVSREGHSVFRGRNQLPVPFVQRDRRSQ